MKLFIFFLKIYKGKMVGAEARAALLSTGSAKVAKNCHFLNIAEGKRDFIIWA
jgi:hypothetical protein